MNAYPKLLKHKLLMIIRKMADSPEPFVCSPGKDFTRKRKLDFETMCTMIIGMNGNSIRKALYEYFDYDVNAATNPAFCQQRAKLNENTFKHLFNAFTAATSKLKLHKDYRLLAIDGSALNIHHVPDSPDTYVKHTCNAKGYSALHLNALYDLKNKLYADCLVQHGKAMNEYQALCDMVDRSSISSDVIVIGDRGYESYNVFAHVMEKGWKYLIRVKDKDSNGITKALDLPETDEFDTTVTVQLSRNNSKKTKASLPFHKFVPWSSQFDYLDNSLDHYTMTFRILRFKISEDTYRMVFTNLFADEFSFDEIDGLYSLRWGVETSFRELKYAIGLTSFHSKKVAFILQEIYARLIMYNFCEMITMQVTIRQKCTKHVYQVNFTAAIDFCKKFFCTRENEHPPDIEALLRKNILPIRKGRMFQRIVRRGRTISFNYRTV